MPHRDFHVEPEEVHRPRLLTTVGAGRITGQAATALRLSVRTGPATQGALPGWGSPRPAAWQSRAAVASAAARCRARADRPLDATVYAGFNDTHLTEKLREQHHLPVCRESVRRVRRQLGLPSSGRAGARARRRRAPEEARGALIQIDGSPFAWLEDRGPSGSLLGAVDDATTEILALTFRPAEDVHGYMTLFRDVFAQHGLPLAVYGDRLNILVRNDPHWSLEEQLAGTQFPTHIGRLLQELGVGYIAAHSPQAKVASNGFGRPQDRLVSELRLRRIATVEMAQAYLPPHRRLQSRLRQAPGRRHRRLAAPAAGPAVAAGVAIIAESPATTPCRWGYAGSSSAAGAPTRAGASRSANSSTAGCSPCTLASSSGRAGARPVVHPETAARAQR